MKKLLVITVLVVAGFTMTSTTIKDDKTTIVQTYDEYCDGWEDGYCEGWKDVKGQYAVCPVEPPCPVPKNDCWDGYKCGYNRGFKAGMRAANRDDY